ncbi:hypothetical protein ACIBI9_24285 [Nonomuraea sp. NPDC050451]|uniref:hypothetical protein n=1 Tax=Nonomuraea sp. NPDC050451 TaxID=3364364 RepID=UPI00378958FB
MAEHKNDHEFHPAVGRPRPTAGKGAQDARPKDDGPKDARTDDAAHGPKDARTPLRGPTAVPKRHTGRR